MSSREIEVTCPCCSARLVVDTRTAQVMKTVRKEEAGESAAPKDRWADASSKVQSRTQSGLDKLESALEYERNKTQRFDEMFKKATDKHTPKPPEDGDGE
jgi:hypothetical protein